MSYLSHTHPQQALIQAPHLPALAHQRIVGLLSSVAAWGSYKRNVKHTTTLRWQYRYTRAVIHNGVKGHSGNEQVSARCRTVLHLESKGVPSSRVPLKW